jgi:glucosyl-dolichyl phosphate glucuronosyltransferase
MNVSVVLCTYDRARMLRRVLDSLAAMDVPPDLTWELIVVDNNSSDDTAAVVSDAAARLTAPCRYLFERRQGKSFALNTGIEATTGEIVALIDDDETVHAGWVAAVRRAFAAHDCLGIGGRITPLWNRPKPPWYTDTGPRQLSDVLGGRYDFGDLPRPVPSAPLGGNMAYLRRAFEKHGMFNTRLGRVGRKLVGGEDTEFGQRLLDAGETLFYAPDAIVYAPVDPERLRRTYFESWYHDAGTTEARMEPPRPEVPRWFGVPRYLLRAAVEHRLLSLTTPDSGQRFYHKLQFLRYVGQITEVRGRTG